jgi:carbon-monoxide dehydrogenase large subunit
VIERVMDFVATELGLDPVKVRLKNMPESTEFPFKTATGLLYDSGNYQAALEKAQGSPSGRSSSRSETRRGRRAGSSGSAFLPTLRYARWVLLRPWLRADGNGVASGSRSLGK